MSISSEKNSRPPNAKNAFVGLLFLRSAFAPFIRHRRRSQRYRFRFAGQLLKYILTHTFFEIKILK
jgi:hypothetical protein